MPVTWIVDADSSYARIFAQRKAGAELDEIIDLTNPGARLKGEDLESDKPGRSYDSRGSGRHAMEPRHTHKETGARHFAERINDYLVAHDTEFDALVLVCPPKFLGELRKRLDDIAGRKVVREIGKDVVRLDMQKIRELL